MVTQVRVLMEARQRVRFGAVMSGIPRLVELLRADLFRSEMTMPDLAA
jgi:hypothetical protein